MMTWSEMTREKGSMSGVVLSQVVAIAPLGWDGGHVGCCAHTGMSLREGHVGHPGRPHGMRFMRRGMWWASHQYIASSCRPCLFAFRSRKNSLFGSNAPLVHLMGKVRVVRYNISSSAETGHSMSVDGMCMGSFIPL